MPYVYDFDHSHPRPPMELKDLLGGKGANLAEMTSVLELPVPPGFTLSTDACRAYMSDGWPKDLDAEVAAARSRLEKAMGKAIGDAADPLLVSVRSGAKFSMPGMMDAVLNLGLNEDTTKGVAALTQDERFALDARRRFIQMFGKTVKGIDGQKFERALSRAKKRARVKTDPELSVTALRTLVRRYLAIYKDATGHEFPSDPMLQLREAIDAVFRSWNTPR